MDMWKRIRQQADFCSTIQRYERRKVQGLGLGEIALEPIDACTLVQRTRQCHWPFASLDEMLHNVAADDSATSDDDAPHSGYVTQLAFHPVGSTSGPITVALGLARQPARPAGRSMLCQTAGKPDFPSVIP